MKDITELQAFINSKSDLRQIVSAIGDYLEGYEEAQAAPQQVLTLGSLGYQGHLRLYSRSKLWDVRVNDAGTMLITQVVSNDELIND